MTITPAASDPLARWTSGARSPLLDRQRTFAAALGRAESIPERLTPEQTARRQAEQLVAITFVQPILRETREANATPPPFGPSQAERQLGPIFDAQIADRLVRASNFPIVDRIASDLMRRLGGAALSRDGTEAAREARSVSFPPPSPPEVSLRGESP
ncbi:MAG: hypothetical protein H6811_02750 [Phycisphaeraceae bacterium]|nr:hypothetical protein [Phycisphaeraceae bacterium]